MLLLSHSILLSVCACAWTNELYFMRMNLCTPHKSFASVTCIVSYTRCPRCRNIRLVEVKKIILAFHIDDCDPLVHIFLLCFSSFSHLPSYSNRPEKINSSNYSINVRGFLNRLPLSYSWLIAFQLVRDILYIWKKKTKQNS